MDLKTFQTVERIGREIHSLAEARKEVYNTVHSPSMDGVRSSTRSDPVQKAMQRLYKIDEKISLLTIEKAELSISCLDWLFDPADPVPPEVVRILINRYLTGMSWKDTARRLKKSESAIKNRVYRYFAAAD